MKEKTKKPKPKLPIPHYICIAWCGLETDTPGKCRTPGCRRHRNPLTECRCQNGKHTKLHQLYQPR